MAAPLPKRHDRTPGVTYGTGDMTSLFTNRDAADSRTIACLFIVHEYRCDIVIAIVIATVLAALA